ncbi:MULTISPECIES: DsbE family thiol:disulfide interchange protein [unclassified Pseudomonas]|uniref:DsbE family thiol:disulfide interchange protein n=1 Tax=unclassified Pseudomonas TaxID=196821 RepID=UPI000BC3B82A|nr:MULTISPECIES: DsbE family thiol:disulfide interchange protein [unclassified Pseudomonas]PVZ13639.1 cytochrome c biogenesis protein CcmG/thiol:disulfide interchange protein DsbE [Pseudomonas sp. URIL14HWK12:I12]PVZ23945.1 cytochrome c biogenesis protein CcmG/thiol:disulfide interchange protein DsbE [Pseudomonas sp. URIL14HWK12:I10]PVZ33416.1 cytochrome c biogenesis protein CcmG/thiol:disulfide interchange protein DsbE [Pseudomonas sp. URIL14HWK12:I11]SNZ11485.1 cytochrome c biogenesis protein
MKRAVLLVPLALFLLLAVVLYRGLYGQPEVLPSALIGKPLPAFELPAVQGGPPVNRQALLGKPALVNVWGTWCVACREEHPVLNGLKAQGVLIYGIDYKDDNTAARRWLAEFQDPYTLNADDADGSLGLDLGVYGAPETYLIDAQGIIRYKHVGAITEQVWRDELASRYQALLEAPQ